MKDVPHKDETSYISWFFNTKVIDMNKFKLRSLLATLSFQTQFENSDFYFHFRKYHIYVCVFPEDMKKPYFEMNVSKHSDFLLVLVNK